MHAPRSFSCLFQCFLLQSLLKLKIQKFFYPGSYPTIFHGQSLLQFCNNFLKLVVLLGRALITKIKLEKHIIKCTCASMHLSQQILDGEPCTTSGISFSTNPLRPAPPIMADAPLLPIPTILSHSPLEMTTIPSPCSAVCKASKRPLARRMA